MQERWPRIGWALRGGVPATRYLPNSEVALLFAQAIRSYNELCPGKNGEVSVRKFISAAGLRWQVLYADTACISGAVYL